MFEIESKARELSELIVNSEIYSKYDSARRKVEEDAELLKGLNEYRKRRFYIQNNPDENMQNSINQLTSEFNYVVNNKTAKEFLDAEYLLCREIRKVTSIIAESIEMDMNFLE